MPHAPLRESDDPRRREHAARLIRALSRRAGALTLATTVVVATVGGALAYRHLVQKARYDALAQLGAHAGRRALREAAAFEAAAAHVLALRGELAHRLAHDAIDPGAFAALAETHPDGATRRRATADRHNDTLFVPCGVPLHAEFKHRLVSALRVTAAHGGARAHGQINTYVLLPESAATMHWPDRPDWDKRPPADRGCRREPQWTRAVTGNPLGGPVWTDPFYDPQAGARLIACVAPLIGDGRVLAVAGMDLPLDTLVTRLANDAVDGATHMIVRHDGTLLAHPDFAPGGATGGPPPANPAREALLRALPKPESMLTAGFTEDGGQVLVAAEIPGLGARYVSVLPTARLSGNAARDALIFTGALALVFGAQGGILYALLRRRVINRIDRFARRPRAPAETPAAHAHTDTRLDSLLNTVPGIVFTCRMDANWTILYISEHVERMTGYPAGRFLDGSCTFPLLTHPEDAARVAAEIRQKADLDRGYVVEYRIITGTGETLHVREEARFGVDPETGDAVIDGIIHDIEDIHARSRDAAGTATGLARQTAPVADTPA